MSLLYLISIQPLVLLSITLASTISANDSDLWPEDVCDAVEELPSHIAGSSFIQASRSLASAEVQLHELTRRKKQSQKTCVPPSAAAFLQAASVEGGGVSGKQSASDTSVSWSFLHEIVGKDGVLQISLERMPERASYASEQLKVVGISPTVFPATDASCTAKDVLEEACNEICSPEEAAVAHSHKRALEAAGFRNEQWTAILEDDAVPVLADSMTASEWDSELRSIWPQVPTAARIIRLSWCWPKHWSTQWESPAIGQGKMKLTQFLMQEPESNVYNSVGLCTSAYIVHQDIIPKLRSTFPCNVAIDACLSWKFYPSAEQDGIAMSSLMFNIDMQGSTEFIRNTETSNDRVYHAGIMKQAYSHLGSTIFPNW